MFFRILTCLYRANISNLENEIKSNRENLYQRTEKLCQVLTMNLEIKVSVYLWLLTYFRSWWKNREKRWPLLWIVESQEVMSLTNHCRYVCKKIFLSERHLFWYNSSYFILQKLDVESFFLLWICMCKKRFTSKYELIWIF